MSINQEVADRDRDQIGLPDETDDLLKVLVKQTPWFKNEMDVYRLAITVALARGLEPRLDESETYTTKYQVSSLDPDGRLKLLITTFAPDQSKTPYRWAMRLANKGVKFLHSALIDKGLPIGEALGLPMREV